ncbi:MAG TPA: phosphate signaling complex protein PhoU [Myxococcota bacterium]|nr:phosphate signaling complex protein PhoU [Myxococcota bacterium]
MTRAVDPVLADLRESLLRMGSRAEAILDRAVQAVIDRDAELARQVEPDDLEIDRLDVLIDGAVLRALALQAPVAADLRRVVAVKMIATDLERVGDLSRNIAKSALRLSLHPEVPVPLVLVRLARSAQRMLHEALDAYSAEDAEAARRVLAQDEEVDRQQDEVVRSGLQEITGHPELASQAVDLIFVAKNLERVGDHATNIAEDVILVTEARNVKHASKLGA